jgi:hypothetical protein
MPLNLPIVQSSSTTPQICPRTCHPALDKSASQIAKHQKTFPLFYLTCSTGKLVDKPQNFFYEA